MRKIAFLLIFIPLISSSQESETRIVGDTLFSKSGYKVIEKQEMNIGTGSMQDGDFKFIRKSATSLFKYSSDNGYQGLANQQTPYREIVRVSTTRSFGSIKEGLKRGAIHSTLLSMLVL